MRVGGLGSSGGGATCDERVDYADGSEGVHHCIGVRVDGVIQRHLGHAHESMSWGMYARATGPCVQGGGALEVELHVAVRIPVGLGLEMVGCPDSSMYQGIPGDIRGYGMLRGATGCYGMLWGATGCYGVLQGATGCYGVLRGATGCYGVLVAPMATHPPR